MLPSRILYYTNIVKGESSSKTGKQRFTGIDVAEPHPILYKYSERQEQRQRGKAMTVLLWHCRTESYFMHKSRFIIYKTGALPQRRQHDIRMNIDAYRNEKAFRQQVVNCHRKA